MIDIYWIVCCLLGVLANCTVTPRFMVFGLQPDFLLSVLVICSFRENNTRYSFIAAACFGVIADFMTAGMFGYKIVSFMLTVFISVYLRKNAIRSTAMLCLVVTAASVVIEAICIYVLSLLYTVRFEQFVLVNWFWRCVIVQLVITFILIYPLKQGERLFHPVRKSARKR